MDRIIRRVYLTTILLCAVMSTVDAAESNGTTRPAGLPLNVVLITADDMDYHSLGITGCGLPDITPNLDKLASEGMLFERAHVTVAVCQPSRSVLMTGRYPLHNGALGFEAIRRDVPTLGESLRAAGYFNGVLAKVGHLAPREKFCWDLIVNAAQLGVGRDPALYHQWTRTFIEKATAERKPFFLMANSQDPHRPFAEIEPASQPANVERRRGHEASQKIARTYRPAEIKIPCFLPDLPAIRMEIAQYFTSVHRCDETVGEILRALDETKSADHTLVMFLSDNGMPFPFAKTNCYPFSTHTPWIVRWPGHVHPSSHDTTHFISGIDFMPTVLDALGLPAPPVMDGASFLPLLQGRDQPGRDILLTVFHKTVARREYAMRCIQTGRFCYIYNAWSDGKNIFQNEARGTPSFRAMDRAARDDASVAARVEFFSFRTPEELYDVEKDPCCFHNLVADSNFSKELQQMRRTLNERLRSTGDPLQKAYEARFVAAFRD